MARSLILLVFFFLSAAGISSADSLKSDHVEAEWVPETTSIQPGTPFRLGLRLTHKPHWHTYWEFPGSSGYSTSVAWDLPEGYTVSALHWPVPKWLVMSGEVVFGYEGETMLLVELTPPAGLEVGTPSRLGGKLNWLECEETCIPGGGDLYIDLPVRGETPIVDSSAAAIFSRTGEALPLRGEGWSASAARNGESMRIQISSPAALSSRPGAMQFFPKHEWLFDLSKGLAARAADGGYVVDAPLLPSHEEIPEVIEGVLVAEEGWTTPGRRQGVSITTARNATGTAAGTTAPAIGFPTAVLFAFLGGILLNLMPCVFPVISLKILGFVNLAGEDPRKVWRHGMAFAAGVVISFWVLAGALLILKAAGWGFQLQNPGFVIGMCLLFFLLGLNLFGVFELGTSFMRLGAQGKEEEGMTGSFLSGILATIVATPCTGPFMGVAVGFALTQPAAVSMTVFTALALGMASPYLILSRFPAWLSLLPRPGPWMESLKQFMGFPVMGFALYLVWVFEALQGPEGLGRLLTGLLLAGIAAWVYGRWGAVSRPARTRMTAYAVAAVLLAGGAWVSVRTPPKSPWKDYTPERVQQLRDMGKPVFIDFTATWCVTCQANKKLVLNTTKIQERFKALDVTLIKADWTLQDEPVTSALSAFGRRGVPLYVLYGSGTDSEPHLLPEILTKGIVLRALDEMEGASPRTAAVAPGT
jgi:thiol:disulfide interchange protein